MAANPVCRRCGMKLAESTARGYCPNCLLHDGLAELVDQGAEVRRPESEGRGQRADDGRQKTQKEGAKAESSSSLTSTFGDYELLEKVGQGGMGVVYRARQISLDRIVAVKLLPSGPFLREDAVQRFRTEASAAAGLQHPNIVAIHEVGEHEGQPYFTMDFIKGQTLAEAVRDQSLPAKRAATYLKAIAEAVHYAHEHGILHRDLKPSNVLIDAFDQPRITDFGLAKRLENSELGTRNSELTLPGQVLGSPNFMSPEQAEGRTQAVRPASDIYSLGALLYHLLTRQPPFQADTLTTLLKQVIEADPVPPRLLNPNIPRDLETVCLKCLEKDPRRRYDTAQALAADLDRFLSGQSVQARPVGPGGKTWRWVRRNPRLASAIGVAMLSVLVGLTGILWQWRRAVTGELLARQNAYAADMQGVQTALANGDLGEALACLERHRPPGKSEIRNQKSETDLRGWEWRYFWKLCRSDEAFLLHRYSNSVSALAFSADGRWLAVRRERGAVALWDAAARQLVAELPGRGARRALALSPQGNRLAYGNVGGNGNPVVSLWNTMTRQQTQLPHASAPACHLGFSADGTLLATWASDGTVRLWQVESQQVVTNVQLSKPRDDFQGRILFSPAGAWLAIGETNTVRIWDWPTGKQRTIPLVQSNQPVTALAFSPDGSVLVAACDKVIQAWDVTRVWDLPVQSDVPRIELPTEHRSRVLDLGVAPDNDTLAIASVEQTVRLWSLRRRQELGRYQGNRHQVWAVAFSSNGKDLVSGGRDGSVRFWDPVGRPAPRPYQVLPMPVWSAAFAFSPDGKQFVALNDTNRLEPPSLWDTATLREVKKLSFLGTNNSAVKWSPDGRMFAVGDYLGRIRIWDVAGQHPITNFFFEGTHIGAIRFAGGGRSLLCGVVTHTHGYPRNARIWNVADWREVRLPAEAVQNIKWAAVSPDNRTFASLAADGTVAWWDLASGRRLAQFPQHFASTDGYMAFSPDSRTLAGSATEGLTTLWEVATGRVRETMRGNLRAVHSVAFSPDGCRLVSGGADPTDVVRLMDLTSQRYVATLSGEPDEYWFLEMSADGTTLVAIGMNGTALLWRTPSWAEIEVAEKRSGVP